MDEIRITADQIKVVYRSSKDLTVLKLGSFTFLLDEEANEKLYYDLEETPAEK